MKYQQKLVINSKQMFQSPVIKMKYDKIFKWRQKSYIRPGINSGIN